MAHEIDMSNARANMAFIGQDPWHGLGQRLTENAPIEQWIRESGLDFEVKRSPTFFAATDAAGNASYHPVDDRETLYRSDTMAALGVISGRYKEVQPSEVVEFFRSFVEAGDMHLETAGALKGGKRVWALATNGRTIRIAGQDVIRPYLLLSTTFDGSSATVAHFTTTRVVCKNTLQMSFQEQEADRRAKAQSFISVPHRKKFDADEVKDQLFAYREAINQFEETAFKLADIKVMDDDAALYFANLVGELNKEKKLTTQSQKKIARLLTLYKQGPGAEYRSADGTAWGLVNAITHFVDHETAERVSGARLESAWYGAGRGLKERAVESALALAA